MKLHTVLEAKYANQEQKRMRAIIVDAKEDNYEKIENLFSNEYENGDNYPLDDWSKAGLEFAHIDDQMGSDFIYYVDGRFALFDRHLGELSWAPKGTTEDDVLIAIGYYDDDDDDEDWE